MRKRKGLKKSARHWTIQQLKKNHNTSDGEATILNARRGAIAGYNGQVAVDGKYGIIIHSDVVSNNIDFNLFKDQFLKAIANVGIEYKGGVADAGYSSAKDLKELVESGKDIIVPSLEQMKIKKQREHHKPENYFSKTKFRYDENHKYKRRRENTGFHVEYRK